MLQALRAVLWAFLGIRSQSGYDADRKRLRIWQIILAGFICVAGFIMSLFFLVRMLTSR